MTQDEKPLEKCCRMCQEYLVAIVRNRSGIDSGEIDYAIRLDALEKLTGRDRDNAIHACGEFLQRLNHSPKPCAGCAEKDAIIMLHGKHWTAVANAIGGCYGGVDGPTSDPLSTAGVVVARIAALTAQVEKMRNLMRNAFDLIAILHSPYKPCSKKCDACEWFAAYRLAALKAGEEKP